MIRTKILSLLPYSIELPTDFFELRAFNSHEDFPKTVTLFRPDIIVSPDFQVMTDYPYVRDIVLVVSPNLDQYSLLKSLQTKLTEIYWIKPSHTPVSIFSAAYNTGKLLYETYESLRLQADTRWEWIVMDDGSQGETTAILRDIEQRDRRVNVYLAKNRESIGAVKSDAARLCRGDYLIELDSDDCLTPNAVKVVRETFEANPEVGMVYSNYAFITHANQPLPNPAFENRRVEINGTVHYESLVPDINQLPLKDWLRNFYRLPHHLRAYRATALNRLGGFNHRIRMEEDTELTYRFYVGSKIMHINQLLYLYRDTPTNTVKSTFNLSNWVRDLAIQHFVPNTLHGDPCKHWLCGNAPPPLQPTGRIN